MTLRMLPADMQRANEYRFARAHIDGYIRDFLLNDEEAVELINQGVELLEEYRNKEYSYESKNIRMEMVRDLDLKPIVERIFIASVYAQLPEMLSGFVAKLVGAIGFEDRSDSAVTVAEMVAVLCELDLYDLTQKGKFSAWRIVSNIQLPEKLQEMVERSTYLPPVVCQPRKLVQNKQAIRETCEPESLILNNNHHEGDICLDVLNKKNAVELCLNLEFLCSVEEEPSPDRVLETREQMDSWLMFKKHSHEMYKLMAQQGNRFHLLHKVDKRGRIYAQGYHINTQGSPYKKAMLDLYNKEKVTGVPDHLRIK